jgi:2,4-dienoyl-CoA reductase (NADPH2)
MIGPVRTRNRIIKTANGTSFMEASDQTVGERMIAYYERLAKGGVGLIVVESCGTEYPLAIQHVHYHADGSYEGVQLHLDDDRFIEGFSRLTEAVHKHGCPVSIQLQHAGPWNPTGLLPRDSAVRDVKCASAMSEEELPGPDFLPCRALTGAEIEDQIDLWASAAERAWKAGFDAVEINHGTCHQGNTFLSRVWNRRDDEYGPQSLENRTRFLRSIISETKRRCGPGFAVHTLINIAEYNHPRATTLAEGAGMAVLIGEVADGINCRAERYGHRGGLLQPDRILYPEPPADLPADLDWSRQGKGHRAADRGLQAGRRHGPFVDRLPAGSGPGRGVPAARQPRLRRHDAPPPRRPRFPEEDRRGAARGYPALYRLHALLRHA